jgi:hypothetical protein
MYDATSTKSDGVKIDGFFYPKLITPFENPQRWMGQNTFPILLLNDDNMIGEH